MQETANSNYVFEQFFVLKNFTTGVWVIFGIADGGQGGIRTHGTRERTLVFKTSSLNHSDTCPALHSLIPDYFVRFKIKMSISCNMWYIWSLVRVIIIFKLIIYCNKFV